MTDADIVKALEICGTYKGKCIDCPAFVKVDHSNCKKVLLGASDLISRQKSEIERLQKENKCFADLGKLYSEIKAEAIKEFAERLKDKAFHDMNDGEAIVCFCDIDDLVKEMAGDTGCTNPRL